MSWWTYINGMIKVSPMGRTQAEKTYILQTVLDHLPVVTGSEGDMEVYVNQCEGYESSSSHDELGMQTNNLRDHYGNRSQKYGWLNHNDHYLITISCSLRDRMFEQTLREFEIWLQRLAKRVMVEDILVKVEGYDQRYVFDNYDPYYDMFECPSWSMGNNTGEPNWCEYLMWSRWKDWSIPVEHVYKYYNDEEADKEMERRYEEYND